MIVRRLADWRGGPEVRARDSLEQVFAAAVRAVDAEAAVQRALRRDGADLEIAGRAVPPAAGIWVLSAGKAACAMARAAERWAGDRLRGGLAVTKDGHGLPLQRLAVRETAHPVPDARSEAAGRELLRVAAAIPESDVLLVLLSGGASALCTCPLPGVELPELVRITRALLGSGASISELNCVRKHLVAFSGGRLARVAGAARIDVLAVSDVHGDRLDVIASGPCHGDPSTFADALDVLERHGLRSRLDPGIAGVLANGVRGELPESVSPDDPALAKVRAAIVARNADARRAALEEARSQGLCALDLGEGLSGEARTQGRRLAALGRSVVPGLTTCLVLGGETTVTLHGRGRGGRSQELALAAAIELSRAGASASKDAAQVALLAAGTDGTDGPTDAAGAFVDARSVERGRRRGERAELALERNDSHGFFVAEGGLYRTGPTRTNVMDLVLLRLECAEQPRDR